jgi:hypothetical protein
VTSRKKTSPRKSRVARPSGIRERGHRAADGSRLRFRALARVRIRVGIGRAAGANADAATDI